jgi:crossover junction endodeoxyribonuclease RusA
MSIEVSPPDKRTRDLDNLLKGPLDALAHAGVYTNDRQINDLRIYRGNVIKGGRLTVFIEAIEEEAK